MYWNTAAELGAAVVYEGRRESCPSGFFYGSRRVFSFLESARLTTMSGRPRLWKADEACDQAAI
jgi:hypothetical protein